ncbi:MAG: flap endonuclease [Acidobacteria bacterium]|nr:MAG: flap endonuclease [Acidobacteriota bacterium]
MIIHLIDGTYELFRHFYGARRANSGADTRFGGVRGVLHGVLAMFETGGTHVGVATDHIIESFRNRLWPGYKTGFGIDPVLWSQFHPLEDGLAAMGVVVWPMVELEADDALASAAWLARSNTQVEKICIWTPDKDLAQCVVESRVVQIDGRRGVIRDQAGVQAKFGVLPASIPDYLALVGDSADGYPGISGFGAKSAAAILRRFGRIEEIPGDPAEWRAGLLNGGTLARRLSEQRDLALLFKKLATLRVDAPLFDSVDQLRWQGPTPSFAKFAESIEAPELVRRAELAAARHF